MDEILSKGREQTMPDQWESQVLARILLKHEVIMVTDAGQKMVEDMHLHHAVDLEEAMAKAVAMTGRDDYQVTVVPDGVSVIVR
jgi:nickel-dependent lactate racemase